MNELNLIPSAVAPVGFPFLENHVRARLGIGKDEVRALRQRHLAEGKDWILKKKRIWLGQTGVDGLLKAKRLDGLPASPDAQTANAGDGGSVPEISETAVSKKTAAPKAPEVVTLKVVQLTRNPHIIQCCALEDSALHPKAMVRVRVRTATNFRRYMELPAMLVAGYTDLYDLARACPKKPGKW